MTREEKHLWYDFLRNYSVKFYRQRVISKYIADFYCPKAKIVVELDGSQHFTDEAVDYDNKRSDLFNELGIQVIRYTNHQIHNEFRTVCEDIDKRVSGALKRRSS